MKERNCKQFSTFQNGVTAKICSVVFPYVQFYYLFFHLQHEIYMTNYTYTIEE